MPFKKQTEHHNVSHAAQEPWRGDSCGNEIISVCQTTIAYFKACERKSHPCTRFTSKESLHTNK